MNLNTLKFIAFGVTFSLFLITIFVHNKGVFSFLLMFRAFIELIPLLILSLVFFSKNKKIGGDRFLCGLFFSCILLLFVSIFIGRAGGSDFKYILSDSVRYLISFVFIIYALSHVRTTHDKEKLVDNIIAFLFFYTLLAMIGKVILLFLGERYGAGLNQFLLFPFLIFTLLYGVISKENVIFNINKKWLLLFLVVGILLSILSFKREYWVVLVLSLGFAFYYVRRYSSAYFYFFILAIGGAGIAYLNQGMLFSLVDRLQYTFSGQSGLDSSSFERIAEIKGAMSTLGENVGAIEYLIGLGVGAEFNAHPEFPLIKDSTGSQSGSYHHIHNMYVLILFRNGIVGLFLFVLPVLAVIWNAFKASFEIKRRCLSSNHLKYNIFLVGVALQLFTGLISGISSNSFYGSFFFGIWIVFAFTILDLIKDEKKL
ncbi:hypothetical protein EXT48_14185 [Pseudoalteromonas sp. CO348]|uniref:O-antigen ligase family protein n=1 Tax=Pseudoalteromonas sp. CO348 TaxID=1777271 RepID=UPI00102304A5|nr:O-antigen ligase family protein [Pseudoalteromonas sp. CO348]RZG03148.1 hypothetical protein EXT48_14185 [Pseudoalteromonas sp. CO348]